MTINRSTTAILLGTVVTSLVMLAPATAQDVSPVPAAVTPAALSQAPQNARFLENLNAIKQGRTLNLVTQDGHAFGLIEVRWICPISKLSKESQARSPCLPVTI